MHDYYCKNCNDIVGKWNIIYQFYNILSYCNISKSKKFKSIYFVDCKNCDKFVGILCYNVCENCFGEDEIHGEKILFNWFLKYRKNIPKYPNCCKNCNKYNFRWQHWFFEELTFYK